MSSTKKDAQVLIYTTRACPHCGRAKAYLRDRHVHFRERSLEDSRSALAEFRHLGGRSVPVILIGHRRVDGFHPKRIDKALRHAGLTD